MPLPLSGLLLAIVMAIGGIGAIEPTQSQEPARTPYLEIIARYRAAGSDSAGIQEAHVKAIAALVALPDGHSINHVFKEYERLALSVAGESLPGRVNGNARTRRENAWEQVLPAAAVIHLETAYFLRAANDTDRAMAHLSIARAIVDWEPWLLVMRMRPDIGARHATLRRDIYVGIIWALQAFRMVDRLAQHLERTRDHFEDDAMVRLALGSLEELRATAVELDRAEVPGRWRSMPRVSWQRASQKMRWEKAEEYYRAALKVDPSLAEAHVRLGRVLRLRGKLKEAHQELDAAAAAAPDIKPMPPFGPAMVMPYLREMFLAEVMEEEGDSAAALTRYQEIARRWPACQSGLLALSRAYEARGDRAAALNALQTLQREQTDRNCVDPWWTYNLGQGWRFGPFVGSLRLRLKGAS